MHGVYLLLRQHETISCFPVDELRICAASLHAHSVWQKAVIIFRIVIIYSDRKNTSSHSLLNIKVKHQKKTLHTKMPLNYYLFLISLLLNRTFLFMQFVHYKNFLCFIYIFSLQYCSFCTRINRCLQLHCDLYCFWTFYHHPRPWTN